MLFLKLELRSAVCPKPGAEAPHSSQTQSRDPSLFPNPELRPVTLSPGSGRTGPGKGNGSAQNKQPTQRGFPPSPPSKQMFTVVLVQKLRVWKGSLKSPNCRFQRAACYRHTAISGAQGAAKFPPRWATGQWEEATNSRSSTTTRWHFPTLS